MADPAERYHGASSGFAPRYRDALSRGTTPIGVTRADPWTHHVLDEFFEPDLFAAFATAASEEGRVFEVEADDPFGVQFSLLNDIELARHFVSVDFARLLRAMTGEWCYVSDASIQVRRARADTPEFLVHNDSGGPRSFVALYFVSPCWSPRNGGRLRLHPAKAATSTVALEPTPNRLVVFETAPDHWHSVEKTISGERYSILTEWIVFK